MSTKFMFQSVLSAALIGVIILLAVGQYLHLPNVKNRRLLRVSLATHRNIL